MPGKWARKKKKSAKVLGQAPVETLGKIEHVVVSEVGGKRKHHWPKLTRKQLLIAVALVVAAVGGWAYVSSNKEPAKQEKLPYVSEEGVEIKKLDETALESEVHKLIFEEKFSSAAQLVNFQDNAGTEKPQVLLAMIYVNQGAHDKALDVWLNMDKNNLGEKWKVLRNIGSEYEQLKDKPNALIYYKRAQDTLKQTENVPVKDEEIHFLDRDIKRVET